MRKVWGPCLVLAAMAAANFSVVGLGHGGDAAVRSSAVDVVVGFEPGRMPTLAVGQRLEGWPIAKRSSNGSFLTVAAPSLAVARAVLGARPGVAFVEADGVAHALAVPTDARYPQQYGPRLMGAPAAWDTAGFGSEAVTVAVVDTGLRKTHEDLTGGRLLAGHDYVNADDEPEDDCGHGTSVAGIIGATTNNALGVAGMSQSKLLPLKALKAEGDSCFGANSDIAQAIVDAADAGAAIINLSLGSDGGSLVIQSAVDHAASKGSLVVAAAGSDDHGPVNYPAAYDHVIAVGAVGSNKALASYSNVGPELDVVAPGTSIVSASGLSDDGYVSLTGTSMAAANVSGALALARSCARPGSRRPISPPRSTTPPKTWERRAATTASVMGWYA